MSAGTSFLNGKALNKYLYGEGKYRESRILSFHVEHNHLEGRSIDSDMPVFQACLHYFLA